MKAIPYTGNGFLSLVIKTQSYEKKYTGLDESGFTKTTIISPFFCCVRHTTRRWRFFSFRAALYRRSDSLFTLNTITINYDH